MSILFELGSHGAALCVEKKRYTGGLPVRYRYSKFFQVHKLAIFGLVITWRLRAYVYKTSRFL